MMKGTILQKLPSGIRKILKRARDIAGQKGYRLYIVGGAVRDYLMSIQPVDIDVVVEGNGIELAKEIVEREKWGLVTHEKFLTATLISDSLEVDFSTARREIYKGPAVLPDVFPSTIEEDLMRRDFTINAIAISLNRDDFHKILDPFNGVRDIKNKVIRVLHNKSFIDDPTRAFRAVRYMTRFGSKIEKTTEELIFDALKKGVFGKLTPTRIFNEIKLLLSEKDPAKCIKNLTRFNLLGVFSDRIKVHGRLLKILSAIPDINHGSFNVQQWRVCLLGLLSQLSKSEVEFLTQKYPFDRELINSLNQLNKFKRIVRRLNKRIKNSELFSTLGDFSDEVIIYGIASANSSLLESNIKKFIELKKIQPLLNGNDLKKMGIPSGPLYSKILKDCHLQTLNGRLKKRKDAIKWLKIRLSEKGCV